MSTSRMYLVQKLLFGHKDIQIQVSVLLFYIFLLVRFIASCNAFDYSTFRIGIIQVYYSFVNRIHVHGACNIATVIKSDKATNSSLFTKLVAI